MFRTRIDILAVVCLCLGFYLIGVGLGMRVVANQAVEAGVGEYRIENGRKVFHFKDLGASSVTIPFSELLEEESE